MVDNYNGQVIQISRGNLISRLKGTGSKAAKALAFGELFIHTGEKLDVHTHKIHDKVTNSDLQTIFTGDLFAGCNNTKDVYFLGSGGSLKWGGIVYSAESYEDLVAQAKQNPEHIFMYNGSTSITGKPHLYDPKNDLADFGLTNSRKSIADGDRDPNQIEKLDRSYVAKDSTEWQLRVNPGDLLFYSSALDQIVVIHLSRSTDALTKINVDALVSDSMQLWLKEVAGAIAATSTSETNYDNVPSTLKTFLDGPVRHYQYLVDQYGWKKAVIKDFAGVELPENLETADSKETPIIGTIRLPDPHDGEIYYVPFRSDNLGYNTYTVIQEEPGDGELLDQYKTLHIREGDLLIALPDAEGGVKFALVSLYGELLDKFRFDSTIERADKYATDIWKIGISGEYIGDHAYQVAHKNISDFIDRLFKTKVDIDPTTGKIISSQLPDFLLGAPKYMGHFTGGKADWSNLTAETTAENFAKILLAGGTINWENLDNSEDDTGAANTNNVPTSKEVNDKLKTGCYWIYQGDTIDISQYPGIFHTCADEDDYEAGLVKEEDLIADIDILKKDIAELEERITEAAEDINDKTVVKNALTDLSSWLSAYQDGSKTLEEFSASVTAIAAAAGITVKVTDEDDKEAVAITVVDSEEKSLADALEAIELDLDALDNSSTVMSDEKAAKTATLATEQAQLDEIKAHLAQHLLNKGDWVIYNASLSNETGNIGRFEIIDNSSSFIGILVGNTKVAGVAEFKNEIKNLNYTKAWKSTNDGRIETNSIQKSNDINITAANDKITFQNEDKVFAAGSDFLDTQFLPRIAGDRTDKGNVTLINSRFMLLDETASEKYRAGLGVSFPTGYKDTRDLPDATKLFWHYAIPADQWVNNHTVKATPYSFKDTYYASIIGDENADAYVVTTKTRTDVDVNGVVTATGLNFDWIPFMGTELRDTQFYSFAIEHEVDPKLYLPSHSGVLATEKYVNQGFTVVKTIFNDLYEKLLRMTTRGHVDWLQTIRDYTETVFIDPIDPNKGTKTITRHELCDSRVLQERSASSYVLKLFYEQNDITDPYMEYTKAKFNHQISMYEKISTSKANELNATLDYVLGKDDDTATKVTLNPSTPTANDPKPEHVLPNHSGILLNNNSVIDGGEW